MGVKWQTCGVIISMTPNTAVELYSSQAFKQLSGAKIMAPGLPEMQLSKDISVSITRAFFWDFFFWQCQKPAHDSSTACLCKMQKIHFIYIYMVDFVWFEFLQCRLTQNTDNQGFRVKTFKMQSLKKKKPKWINNCLLNLDFSLKYVNEHKSKLQYFTINVQIYFMRWTTNLKK